MEPDDAGDDPFSAEDAVGRQQYRVCSQCGRDCEPEPVPTDAGMRIAFICPVHGVHTVVDPFDGQR